MLSQADPLSGTKGVICVARSCLDLFGRKVIRQLGSFYAALNSYLEEQGVRPGLEEQIRAKGTLLKRRDKTHRPARSERSRREGSLGQTLSEIAQTLPPAKPQDARASPMQGPPAVPLTT